MSSSVLSPLAIIRARETRRSRASHNPMIYLGWGIALLISLGAVVLVFTFTIGYLHLVRDLPSIDLLPLLLEGEQAQLREPTRLFDRTGEEVLLTLQDPNAVEGDYLLLENFPAVLITTTLVTTDPDFWLHSGYRLSSFGSTDDSLTLAQRLVTDLLLWDEDSSPRRELRAGFLARQVTLRYGRKKILEWYLNYAHYGPGVYGADAAARAYLNKSAVDLSLAESAFLAAAAERPAIHPLLASELTLQRQTEILLDMRARGLLSPDELLQASQEKLLLRESSQAVSLVPAFTNLVLQQLATQIPLERLARGGLRIITTLDLDLQMQVACVLQTQLAHLDSASIPDCAAARLLPTLPNVFQDISNLNGEAVIIDPRDGQVLALVNDETIDVMNEHPAGSLLTPFVYLSAFARGFGPATLAWDVPDMQQSVENFDGEFHGPMRLRIAMANDYIVPAAQLFEKIGPMEVWRTLEQFGIRPLDRLNLDSFISFMENRVTLLDAAHVLSVFANQGTLVGQTLEYTSDLHAASVLYVNDVGGRPWLNWMEAQRRPVIGAQLAYLENHVLSDEAVRWPSLGHPNSLEIGRPVAVKLSQTLDGNDTWAVGSTPQRMVAVWVGYADDELVEDVLSPEVAGAIWHALMQYITRDLPVEIWEPPVGIVSMPVCDPSGLLPTVECPNVVNEVFISGNEPSRLDELYHSVSVNRVTGLLATVFTPPSLIEERVYLSAPPQAAKWAQEAGLPIQPVDYDIIAMSQLNPDVHMTSPANFAQVSSAVTLRGTAAGEDFSSYRLLMGTGLNPQRWIQIGDDGLRPIIDGVLGTWDTSNLSGLYIIQLQVTRDNQQIETDAIQVTVDNQPPEVSLLYPLADQVAVPVKSQYILLQVAARDDLSLGQIEFMIDDVLVGALYPQTGELGPFTFAWKSMPGKHQLQVKVYDRAGNSNMIESSFSVK